MKVPEKSKWFQDCLNGITRSNLLSARNARPGRRGSRKLLNLRGFSLGIGLSAVLMALILSPSMQRPLSHNPSVRAFDESISTFASSGCATAKTEWNLTETAWACASGAVGDRRISWVAPNGAVAQTSGSFSGTASDSYSIPAAGSFAQVGTWTVETIDGSGVGFASAQFVVRDPNNATADLSIAKFGPSQTSPTNNINYRVEVTNNGPDAAQNVTLTDSVPANTTFVSPEAQTGPAFTCVTPSDGGTGTISCHIDTLPANATAVFTYAFKVNVGTPDGTVITNVASINSNPTIEPPSPATNDPNTANNSASSSATVTSTSNVCTINCPANFTQDNDLNQCSALVNYSTPTTSGNCGSPPDNAVNCNPPAGSIFPIGATTVTCTTQSGGSCSFPLTVHDTRPASTPTIACPASFAVNESSAGSGYATVSYSTPNATGNCVTVTCNPPSGSRFNAGTTTVNCTGKDSSNNTATCFFVVTVNTSACSLDCPDDKTVSESSPGSGTATVTYSTPTTVGSCPPLTITCIPSSPHSFSVGSTPVSCTGRDGSNNLIAGCSFTVTVNSLPTCAITCPANITQNATETCINNNAPPPTTPCATVTYAPTQTGKLFSTPLCAPAFGLELRDRYYYRSLYRDRHGGQH